MDNDLLLIRKIITSCDKYSEDIDLVVLRREGESNNQLTEKIKTIGKVISKVLTEIQIEGVTHKMGMNRKTAHSYEKEFQGEYGQVRDVIVVEATWLGYHEPYAKKELISLVGAMMRNNDQETIAVEYGMQAFDVQVLEPIRTICEKIMSLVRFSYGENPMADLKQKIRHTYDLHQLLQQEEFSCFFNSAAFGEMLLKVANDDIASFKNNNKWLIHHPTDALLFKDLDAVWKDLKQAYNGDFKDLVYGSFPNEKAVLDTLKRIKERLESITWTINPK